MKKVHISAFLMMSLISITIVGCEKNASQTEAEATQAMDDILSLVPSADELKCTGGGVSGSTCTSEFAFPCPSGWSACPLDGENKTCCKKD